MSETRHELDVTFTVPLEPRGKAAVRARGTKFFKAEEARSWENSFGLVAQAYCPKVILDQPVRVDILAVFGRRTEDLRKNRPDGLMWHYVKPDQDNVAKSVHDALKRIWRDDSRVCMGTVLKVRCERGGHPRVIVRIRTDVGDPEEAARQLGLY